ATVCSGDKYSPDYVERLASAVSKHLTVDYEFVCLTDRSNEFSVNTLPIPLDLKSWWGKVALFSDLIADRILFFDLDTVITGNIDDFANYQGDLALIKPFYRNTGYASGVMNIGPMAHRKAWDLFAKSPKKAIAYCKKHAEPAWNHGDQRWLEFAAKGADYWQALLPGQLVSYKVHCQASGRLPENARVLCFHGKPDPHEVRDPFVVENWH
ncbi:MAG: hypothetical protein WBN40_10800, partial [Pseudomonadales bacterium]